jgi:hypothetical protein
MKSQLEILDDAITLLQTKQKKDLSLLKAQINTTKESLKPINLLKTATTEVVSFVKEEGNIFSKMVLLGTKEIEHKMSGVVAKNRIIKNFERLFTKKSK